MAGVRLLDPATQNPFANDGAIAGDGYGIYGSAAAAWTITNSAAVSAASGQGIDLRAGGSIANGDRATQSAAITGAQYGVLVAGAAGDVANAGLIAGGTNGVGLRAGGSVVNGAKSIRDATITGADRGVYIGGATAAITNFGTITATAGGGVYGAGVEINAAAASVQNLNAIYGFTDGVLLDQGGSVVNGVAGDSGGAQITAGFVGIQVLGAAGTVANYGKILATQVGVNLVQGGSVLNRGNVDHAAVINAGNGVWSYYAAASVVNYGKIFGTIGDAVLLFQGGSVVNGSETDTTARLIGQVLGVRIDSGSGTLVNFGTIVGQTSRGVFFDHGGSITNGSATDTTATIQGPTKAVDIVKLSATLINYGTIRGPVQLDQGGGAKNALLDNFGTLTANVRLGAAVNRLVYEAGSTIQGSVLFFAGSRNIIELGAGTGTLAGLGPVVQNATNLNIDAGASWTVDGTLAGSAFDSGGTIASAVGVGLTGTLAITGDLNGGGKLLIGAGSTAEIGGALGVDQANFAPGGATLRLDAPAEASARIGGFGSGDVIDLAHVIATGREFTDGTLFVTGADGPIAALRFAGSFTTGNFVLTGDGDDGTSILFAAVPPPLPPAAAAARVPDPGIAAGHWTDPPDALGALWPDPHHH